MGFAVTAFVVGAVAFLVGLVPVVGLLLGLTAVVFAILGLVRQQSKGFSITGLSLGAIAALTSLVVTISVFAIGSASENVEDARPLENSDVQEATPTPTPTPKAVEESAQEPSVKPKEKPEKKPATEAVELGSIKKPYPQPYTAVGLFGGEKYKLSAKLVDPNAGALVASWNMFNSEAPAGFKYVVVELTMTGIDPDGVEPSLAEIDLSLASAEGNRYSSEYIVFGEGISSMSDGPTLYPDVSFTGYTAYVVPENIDSFLMYDNGNYIAF